MRALIAITIIASVLFSCRTKTKIVEKEDVTVTKTEVIDTLVTVDSSSISVSIPLIDRDTTIFFETPEQKLTVEKIGGQINITSVSKERQVPVLKKVTTVEVRDSVYKKRESVPSETVTNLPRVIVTHIVVLLIILFIINKLFRA
jgi:hypothetical protein